MVIEDACRGIDVDNSMAAARDQLKMLAIPYVAPTASPSEGNGHDMELTP